MILLIMKIIEYKQWNNICEEINTITLENIKEWFKKQDNDILENIYLNAKDVYYNKNSSDKRNVLKDSHFDSLEDYLALDNVYVGILPSNYQQKETLPYFMPSMNKIKSSFSDVDSKIEKWVKEYNIPAQYVYSDKLDGVSGMYVFNKQCSINKQHQLFTRGNGKIGTNISHFINKDYMPCLDAFKCFLNNQKTHDYIVLRGEFILSKKVFNSKTHGSNARNFVSGIINSKTIEKTHSQIIDFVIYEVIEPKIHDGKFSEMMFLNNLIIESNQYIQKHNLYTFTENKYGKMKPVFYSLLLNDKINAKHLREALNYRKDSSMYECDGIVIYHDNYYEPIDNYKNPTHAFAFKHDAEDLFKWTTVDDVIWNISKQGLLKPTIKIKQITINNVKIDYTTGFNAAFIEANNINRGTSVCIKRSGDVIPVIVEVKKEDNPPLMPRIEYEWNATHVDISINKESIKNTSNPYYHQSITKKIHHFTKTLGIKYIGESIIEKCVKNGITSVSSFCKMTLEDWISLDGIMEKSALKFIEQIKASLTTSTVTLDILMDASCCFSGSLGPKKLYKICQNTHDYIITYLTSLDDDTILYKLQTKLPTMDDIGEKNTVDFINGLVEFKKFYNEFGGEVVKNTCFLQQQPQPPQDIPKSGTIVFTGFRNKVLENTLNELGYLSSSTVSKNTRAVIVKDEQSKKSPFSSKIKKAFLLNIPIYNQQECLTYLS